MTIAPVGATRVITQRLSQHECHECGETATQRHTFLLENARRNPASTAYGKDDVSWCADEEVFTCNEHGRAAQRRAGWCASFGAARFPHMFQFWVEVSREVSA